MPIATASSAYLLEDRASSVLRGIRGEAQKTTAAAVATGKALDRIGSAEQNERLRRYEKRLGSVATTAETMSGRVQRTVSHMEGAIRRDTLKAEARIVALEGRMEALGRVRSSPRVELDGYAATSAQIQSIDRQLAALARRSASPRVGAIGSGGGGGGGGARSAGFLGTGGAGIVTSRTGLLAGAAVLALPVVQALGGATVALGGSLAGAGLGAGATSIAGGGALAAGIGALVSVAKPAATAVKEVRKEQQQYNAAVAQYGAASAQAIEAQKQLDAAIRKAPAGTRNLTRELDMLAHKWRDVTAAGQTDIVGLGAGAASRLRRASPTLGRQANTVAHATRTEGLNLTDWLVAPRQLGTMEALTRAFADNLDEAEGILENVFGTLANIARASIPFFHEGMVFLEHWTGDWEKSTHDIGRTRHEVGGFVDDLKAWGRLTHSAFELASDVLWGGRPAGNSAVHDLTATLDRWDRWVDANPEKIDLFFRNAVSDTAKIASSVADIVHGLNSMATELRPLLGPLTTMAHLFGSLSSSLSPGAAATLFLGLRGARNTIAGRGSRTAAAGTTATGAGGGVPLLLGGGGSSMGARLSARGGATYAVTRELGAGRFAAGAAAAPRVAGGAALRGAGAAGRFALPALAIGGLTGAFGASGANQGTDPLSTAMWGVRNTFQGAGAMFGLAHPVMGTDERTNRGLSRAQQRISTLPGGNAPTGREAERALRDLRPELATAEQKAADAFDNKNNYAEAIAYLKALRGQADAYRDIAKEAQHARDVQHNEASRQKADRLTGSFGRAFDVLKPKIGVDKAFSQTLDGVYEKMRMMAPAGAKILGQNTLQWARAQARANPKLQGAVEDLSDRIERRFSRLGERVTVINGKILSGSRAEWQRIGAAMSDPAEQARQKVTAAFTAIQQQAIGSLRSMGYTSSEASALVKGMESGKYSAKQVGERTGSGQPLLQSQSNNAKSHGYGGIGDGIGDGPGTRGPARRGAGGGGAGLMGANSALSAYASEAARFGLHVTSGLRRGAITSSGNVSLHASGNAIDESGSAAGMLRYARYMAENKGSGLDELIHTPLGYGIKNGQRVPLSFWGPTINADHNDHVHVGDRTPTGGSAGGAMGDVGGTIATAAAASVHLRAKRSGLKGVPGGLADRASQLYAAGLEQQINAHLDGAGASTGVGSGGGGGGANRALARRMMIAYGGGKWGAGQWSPLNSLWTRESNFDENAINAKSGAGGIPQALPPSKMGPGWQGNPRQQIGWGLGYIDGRYGTPAAAWGHSQAVGWYGSGGSGTARKPTVIGIGDHPRGENFKVTPRRLGPPSTRAGSSAASSSGRGLGSVTIQSMTVNWKREGDLTQAIKDEIHQAFAELAIELDEGVAADEDALIR